MTDQFELLNEKKITDVKARVKYMKDEFEKLLKQYIEPIIRRFDKVRHRHIINSIQLFIYSKLMCVCVDFRYISARMSPNFGS